jgi:hypothetical protein
MGARLGRRHAMTDSDRHHDVDPDPDECEVELSAAELLAACVELREQQLRTLLEDRVPPRKR